MVKTERRDSHSEEMADLESLSPRERLRLFLTRSPTDYFHHSDRIFSQFRKLEDLEFLHELLEAKKRGSPELLAKLLKDREAVINQIGETDDMGFLDHTIATWNLALREVSAASIIQNWDLFKEACIGPEEKIRSALGTIGKHRRLYADDGPSLHSAFAYIRRQYSEGGSAIEEDRLPELSQAIITVLRGLDLPSLLTEPLHRKIDGNKDVRAVVNFLEVWGGVEDPFALTSPHIENAALDLIMRIADEKRYGIVRLEKIVKNHQITFRNFCYMLQELHRAATSQVSAWSQLASCDARDILNFLTQHPLGNVMTEELLLLIDNGFIISPYQFQKFLDGTNELSLYQALKEEYKKAKKEFHPSRLFMTIAQHSYSVSSLERAGEYRCLKETLPCIDTDGIAPDVGSSVPICLLKRCQDLGWRGPVISVDREPISGKLLEETVFYRSEFSGISGNRLSSGQLRRLYEDSRREVPQHQHHTATLPEDLSYLAQLIESLSTSKQPLTLVEDQAFSSLYLDRNSRIAVRRSLLSKLKGGYHNRGYAIFTARFTAVPRRLNDVIISRNFDGGFFVKLTEEKQNALGHQTLGEIIGSGRLYDRTVQIFPTLRQSATERIPSEALSELPERQTTIREAINIWMQSLVNIGLIDNWEQLHISAAICGAVRRFFHHHLDASGTAKTEQDHLSLLCDALFSDCWPDRQNLGTDLTEPAVDFLFSLKQKHPYLLESLRELIANTVGCNRFVNLARSLQGPLLFDATNSNAIPVASFPLIDWCWDGQCVRMIDPFYDRTDEEKPPIQYETEMKKRGFRLFGTSSLLYDQDPEMYVLSLGRAEIESLITLLILGRREGKPLSQLLRGEEERMAGCQVCLRHRDTAELARELANPDSLRRHLTLFLMYGYFLIREKGTVDPFEVTLPAWNYFLGQGLRPEHFWAVVHPEDRQIQKMLTALGIPPEHIQSNARACMWRQGGSPNPKLGGSLLGRNFELFYEMPNHPKHEGCGPGCPCGYVLELLNVINMQGIEGDPREFDFEVWEAAFGWERLRMAVLAEESGHPVSIYDLPELQKLVENIRSYAQYHPDNEEELILRLADLYRAACVLTIHMSGLDHTPYEVGSKENYKAAAQEILDREGKMPRYRRIGQSIIRETDTICRLLGISRKMASKLYLGWLWRIPYQTSRSGGGQVSENIMFEEAKKLDRVILNTFKDPSGPLYLALRFPQKIGLYSGVARDVYMQDLRVKLGLPPALFSRVWDISQQLATRAITTAEQLQQALNKQLGLENDESIDLSKEAEQILNLVRQEQLRQRARAAQETPPVAKKHPSLVKEPPGMFSLEITSPYEGKEAVDMTLVLDRAASILAADLPNILENISLTGDVGFIGIGNYHPLANATPHNMGYDVVEVLRLALRKYRPEQVVEQQAKYAHIDRFAAAGGTIHLLQNQSDINDAGLAIREAVEKEGLENISAILLSDDLRAHLGSWSPAQKGIPQDVPHRGVASVRLNLGSLPWFAFGTFTADQRGAPINNLLRQYAKENEEELTEALVLYAKRALLSLT